MRVSGAVSYVQLGRRVLYLREDLDKLIQTSRTTRERC